MFKYWFARPGDGTMRPHHARRFIIGIVLGLFLGTLTGLRVIALDSRSTKQPSYQSQAPQETLNPFSAEMSIDTYPQIEEEPRHPLRLPALPTAPTLFAMLASGEQDLSGFEQEIEAESEEEEIDLDAPRILVAAASPLKGSVNLEDRPSNFHDITQDQEVNDRRRNNDDDSDLSAAELLLISDRPSNITDINQVTENGNRYISNTFNAITTVTSTQTINTYNIITVTQTCGDGCSQSANVTGDATTNATQDTSGSSTVSPTLNQTFNDSSPSDAQSTENGDSDAATNYMQEMQSTVSQEDGNA